MRPVHMGGRPVHVLCRSGKGFGQVRTGR
ncbi:MAG: hypothetical protein QOE17_353, partial [Gaiellales bacterium]|nr:hypothetical protein [Gaiellales bacterium]